MLMPRHGEGIKKASVAKEVSPHGEGRKVARGGEGRRSALDKAHQVSRVQSPGRRPAATSPTRLRRPAALSYRAGRVDNEDRRSAARLHDLQTRPPAPCCSKELRHRPPIASIAS